MSIKTDSAGNQYIDVDMTTGIQKKLTATDSVKERRSIAYAYIMDNLRGRYPTDDMLEIIVTKRSADKLTNMAPDIRLKVVPELANIIRIGKHPQIKDAEHSLFVKFAYYDVRFKLDNDCYTAVMNVGIRENGESVLYQINQFKNEAAPYSVGEVRNPTPDDGAAP
ncbi:hypothetical protein R80B4_00362 [Fibrobacteres bacterium R8-0-B4]